MPPFKPLLTALALLTGTSAARDAQDLLLVLPLDTAVLVVDSGVPVDALRIKKTSRRDKPSPNARVARAFHPAFGDAIAHAARGVDVIDSSAAHATVTWPDADSSRYVLIIESLAISRSTRTSARRTVPPSPPHFDPTTGLLMPGVRRSYSEGPARVTTLTAVAAWSIRDQAGNGENDEKDGDSVVATGTATGTTEFRGDARRADWSDAARALALDLLRHTSFAPDDVPPARTRPGKDEP